MDQNGVDQAVIICARLDGNRDNNEYVAGKARTEGGGKKIFPFFDLDSCWLPTHHRPGAARRLQQLLRQAPIRGITHYLRREDDGAWLNGDDASALFQLVAENYLVFSLSCYPHQHPAIRTLAESFPSIPILLATTWAVYQPPSSPAATRFETNLRRKSAALPNIFIKVSGFPLQLQSQLRFPLPPTPWQRLPRLCTNISACQTHVLGLRLSGGAEVCDLPAGAAPDKNALRLYFQRRQGVDPRKNHVETAPAAPIKHTSKVFRRHAEQGMAAESTKARIPGKTRGFAGDSDLVRAGIEPATQGFSVLCYTS